jgi:hypothetical protein
VKYSRLSNVIDFEVTQEDIDKGGRGASTCPVALAINRATGAFAMVGWLDASIYWGDTEQITLNYAKRRATVYSHNRSSWVKAFDYGQPVRPFVGRLTRVGS